MICSSVCLLRFIVWSFLKARLQFTLDKLNGATSSCGDVVDLNGRRDRAVVSVAVLNEGIAVVPEILRTFDSATPSGRYYIASVALGNFKSVSRGSPEKRGFTTGTEAVVQLDYDCMRSGHPVQVAGIENVFLRALDVELEEIDPLKPAFSHGTRDGQPLYCGTFFTRRFESKAPRVRPLVCDNNSFWPMPHRRMNCTNALLVPRVPQEQLIVFRMWLYRDDIGAGKRLCEE